jgi:CRISPR-associated protein Csm5
LEKLIAGLMENGLIDKFTTNYMTPNFDYDNFFLDNGISFGTARKWETHRINIAGIDNFVRRDLHQFIRDPYGKPYVPGSSIKGAMKSAILSGYLIDNPELAKSIAQRVAGTDVRRVNQLTKSIEEEIMAHMSGGDTDIFRHFIVSDSAPLPNANLRLCKKIDVRMDGESKSEIPLLRECLIPKSPIRFTLTIDLEKFPADINKIFRYIQLAQLNYKKKYLSKYDAAPQQARELPLMSVFLGGGTGYGDKTISNALGFRDDEQRLRVIGEIINENAPSNHKHREDVNLGVAPKVLKTTKLDGHHYLMGLCSFSKNYIQRVE